MSARRPDAAAAQRLILTAPAGVDESRLGEALTAGDVAAVVFGSTDAGPIALAQGTGAAALVLSSVAGWSAIGGADGLHAVGTLADRLALLAGRDDKSPRGSEAGHDPENAARTVGAMALDKHEAMMLAEAGADYVWFGAGIDEPPARELASWWSALFEVPAVIYGPLACARQMVETGAEFIAIADAFDDGSPAAAVSGLSAMLVAR